MKRITSLLILSLIHFGVMAQTPKIYNLVIGTYTSGKSEGIYVYEFNSLTGEVKYKNKATGVEPKVAKLAPLASTVPMAQSNSLTKYLQAEQPPVI